MRRGQRRKQPLFTTIRFWVFDHPGFVFIVSTLVLVGLWFWLHSLPVQQPTKQPSTSRSSNTKKSTPSVDTTPRFATVLPENKTIEQLGGWTRVSPATSDPVFAYKDTLDGTELIVSQQPLPEGFEQDIDIKLEELATSLNATEHLPIAGGTAYIGNSIKGPQTIIATKNGLLILIKSPLKHSNDAWTGYLASLR